VSSKEIRLVIPTNGKKGIRDTVSEVFGRAKTLTIIGVKEGSISDVEVLENPALSYRHGAGPIVVKMLVDIGVDVIAAREFGPGASALLKQHNVKMLDVRSGVTVAEAVEGLMKNL
jgi:predicted Fe-Mo cluster-binding NifX family protein